MSRSNPRDIFYFIGNPSYEIKTLREERTAAEVKSVVKTTRRRRRILQAGFHFIPFNQKPEWRAKLKYKLIKE